MKYRNGAGGPKAERFFCLAFSAVLLAICSRSSPFYPLNYWVDANCFFTMGKSMMSGMVLYRDIYEQKGPLLYLLHGLAYLISNNGFLGVYLIEVLAFALFLLSVIRILRLYTAGVPYLIPAVLGAVIATSASFGLGDSAEELCLPLVSWSLYFMLKALQATKKDGSATLRVPVVILNGFFAGCVLWMKYTMLGFYMGWIIIICLLTLRKEGFFTAFRAGVSFLSGMLIATLPWIVYFAVNHACYDLWVAYFHNNIFLYTISSGSFSGDIKHSVGSFLTGLRHNPGYALPIAAGMLWTLLCPRKHMPVFARAGIFTTFTLLAAGVYIGGRAYAYYALILSAYAVLGAIPVLMLMEKAVKRVKNPPVRAVGTLISVCGLVLCVVFSFFYSNDTNLFGADKSAVVQYGFSEVMHQMDDDPTLLNYGFMDEGFYTAAHIVPTCKYFCILNIPLEDMKVSQDECLRSGEVEFVVTKNKALDVSYFDKYEQVYSDQWYAADYYLYRLSD